ncbi:hypothetical protein GW17_00018059 [Ensete ventricosum]|nr:hypothetical protein GW17_00018059 [Ensete ventricosum]
MEATSHLRRPATDRDCRGRAVPDLQVLPFLPSPLADTARERVRRLTSIVTNRFLAVTRRKQPQSMIPPSSGRSACWSTTGSVGNDRFRLSWSITGPGCGKGRNKRKRENLRMPLSNGEVVARLSETSVVGEPRDGTADGNLASR